MLLGTLAVPLKRAHSAVLAGSRTRLSGAADRAERPEGSTGSTRKEIERGDRGCRRCAKRDG